MPFKPFTKETAPRGESVLSRMANRDAAKEKEAKMPFKSRSQRALFYSMAKRGDMSPSMVKRWESETPSGKLPAQAKKKRARGIADLYPRKAK